MHVALIARRLYEFFRRKPGWRFTAGIESGSRPTTDKFEILTYKNWIFSRFWHSFLTKTIFPRTSSTSRIRICGRFWISITSDLPKLLSKVCLMCHKLHYAPFYVSNSNNFQSGDIESNQRLQIPNQLIKTHRLSLVPYNFVHVWPSTITLKFIV